MMSVRIPAVVFTFLIMSTCWSATPIGAPPIGAPPTGAPSPDEVVKVGKMPLPLIVNKPEGKGPFPLLVIVPARQYLMKEKIFEALAQGAVKLGYYVVRFNWGYTVKSLEPSADLSIEVKELDAVLEKFVRKPEVDPGRIVLAAKSFGSKVAMLGPYQKATAILLLTPNCSAEDPFLKVYRPLVETKQKTQIVISATDPYCDLLQIYGALPELGPETTITTLAGDHNFVLPNEASPLNEDLAIQASLNWLNQLRFKPEKGGP